MSGVPTRRVQHGLESQRGLSAAPYKVGHFTIGSVLGVGSFGKVKLATRDRRRGGGEYAVKIMEKDKIRVKGLSAQIRREVQVMQALGAHPNVVQLHSVETSQDKVYIFMELVNGGELFEEIVRNTRLSEIKARFYFGQLICGLAACHARGIYHRDLKPENLLIDDSGLLKISDFGLSSVKKQHPGSSTALAAASFRQRERERDLGGPAVTPMTSLGFSTGRTLLHTQCGTPNYVAPEIITVSDEQGYSGSKVDAWSCGVILYVLVAGALPFDAEEMDVLFRRILGGDIQYPAHFSKPLVELCKGLLQTDPDTRFSLRDVAESNWMTMPAEELMEICGDTVSCVPSYPPGYVGRFPWDEGGDGVVSGEMTVFAAVPGPADNGGAIHDSTTMDSLDFGNARRTDFGAGSLGAAYAGQAAVMNPGGAGAGAPRGSPPPGLAGGSQAAGYEVPLLASGGHPVEGGRAPHVGIGSMLPPPMGDGIVQGGGGAVETGRGAGGPYHEHPAALPLDGGNNGRSGGSGDSSRTVDSHQSSAAYSSTPPVDAADQLAAQAVEDQHLVQRPPPGAVPGAHPPNSYSRDGLRRAMVQIQNEITAASSGSAHGRSSGSEGASAQGRTNMVVAAAAAAAATATGIPPGSKDHMAVAAAAAAASAAASAVVRSGGYQAKSASSAEDANELWRRKVEVDPSGAAHSVYFPARADSDSGRQQASLDAKMAATDMVHAAHEAASAYSTAASAASVAEQAAFRAATAASAAVAVLDNKVPQIRQPQPQQFLALGPQQAYPQAHRQYQPRQHGHVAPQHSVQFPDELSTFRSAAPSSGPNPLLVRRLSRSGASFRNSPKPVMVDGTLMGGPGSKSKEGSPASSPLAGPQRPAKVMASAPGMGQRPVPTSVDGNGGTLRTAPAAASSPQPSGTEGPVRGDQQGYQEILQEQRQAVMHLQERQLLQQQQLERVHARQRLRHGNHNEQRPQQPSQAHALSEVEPRSSSQADNQSQNQAAARERSQNQAAARERSQNQAAARERSREVPKVHVDPNQSTSSSTADDGVSVGDTSARVGNGVAGVRYPDDEGSGSLPSPDRAHGRRFSGPRPFEQSAIGVNRAESGKQENMFKMNIPRPALGPPPPPQQSKLFAALPHPSGKKKKKKQQQHEMSGASTGSGASNADGASNKLAVSRLVGNALAVAPSVKYTQFYSLNSPHKCFEMLENVLRAYGCSQVSGKPSGSESFKIRCVKVVERHPVVAGIDIYRSDGELSAISFKRKGSVDPKRFCQLYDDVHRLFTEKCSEMQMAEDALSSLDEGGVSGSSPLTRTGRTRSSTDTAGSGLGNETKSRGGPFARFRR